MDVITLYFFSLMAGMDANRLAPFCATEVLPPGVGYRGRLRRSRRREKFAGKGAGQGKKR